MHFIHHIHTRIFSKIWAYHLVHSEMVLVTLWYLKCPTLQLVRRSSDTSSNHPLRTPTYNDLIKTTNEFTIELQTKWRKKYIWKTWQSSICAWRRQIEARRCSICAQGWGTDADARCAPRDAPGDARSRTDDTRSALGDDESTPSCSRRLSSTTVAANRCCRWGKGREWGAPGVKREGAAGVERTWARGCRPPREGLLPGDSHEMVAAKP
jgi:hypothetical protein